MTFQIEGSSNFRAGKACQGLADATIQVALRSQKVRVRIRVRVRVRVTVRVRVRATVCESAERERHLAPFLQRGLLDF